MYTCFKRFILIVFFFFLFHAHISSAGLTERLCVCCSVSLPTLLCVIPAVLFVLQDEVKQLAEGSWSVIGPVLLSFNKLFLFYSFTLSSRLVSPCFRVTSGVEPLRCEGVACGECLSISYYGYRYVEHLNQDKRYSYVFITFVTIYTSITIGILKDMFNIVLIVYFVYGNGF
jgi:hypothetical protein